jgi:hypothetical protein
MRPVALAAVSLMAASPSPAQSRPLPAEPVSIPFTTNADAMVIMPASVGGTIPIHVILDTGAGLDILAPSLIRKVHGTSAGAFSGTRMTGERVDSPLFVVPELAVGPMVRKDAVVGGWDVLDSLRLDGIISANGFRRQPFTIDFTDQVVTFEGARSLARRRAVGQTAPLLFDDLHGRALDLFAAFLIGNQPGECEIDTGSQNAAVSTRYLALLGVDTAGKDVVKREGRTVAGAKEVRYTTRLAQLSLATTPEIVLAHPNVAFSDIIYDCVIGTDFWSGRVLTIDIANRQLTVASSHPVR